MDCYYELKIKSTSRENLLRFAENVEDWSEPDGTFLQKIVPYDLVKDDPVFGKLVKKNKAFRIMKMIPDLYYGMHTDDRREVAINMVLNDDYNSHTFFDIGGFRAQQFRDKGFDSSQFHIKCLKYELDACYLLNTQIRHAVLNLEKVRYVVSYGGYTFGEKTYDEIKQSLIDHGF